MDPKPQSDGAQKNAPTATDTVNVTPKPTSSPTIPAQSALPTAPQSDDQPGRQSGAADSNAAAPRLVSIRELMQQQSQRALENVRRAKQAGVRVLVGTGAGLT